MLLAGDEARGIEIFLQSDAAGEGNWETAQVAPRAAETELRTKHGYGTAARFSEVLTDQRSSWREISWLLLRAIVMCNRAEDATSCLRCHGRIRRSAPATLPPRQKMAVWRPAGVAIAYAMCGHAAEAIREIEEIAATVTEWSVLEKFQLHLAMGRVYLEMEQWFEAEAQYRQFVQWAKSLHPDSDSLHMGNVSTDGTIDYNMHGDAGRWYCICEIFAIIVVRAMIGRGGPTASGLADLRELVALYEEGWKRAQKQAASAPNDTALAETETDFRKGVGAACDASDYAMSVENVRTPARSTGRTAQRQPALFLRLTLRSRRGR